MRAKQFAIGIGIALLLPLSVYYGVLLFSPPPDSSKYYEQSQEYSRRLSEAKTTAEKDRIVKEKSLNQKRQEEAQKRHQQHIFLVAYPVGLLAIIIGSLLTVQAVGAGLMFGGIFTLAEGCYSYWDKMPDWTRFFSLIIAMAVLIGFGYWKFPPEVKNNASS
jgi:hypothetical protein